MTTNDTIADLLARWEEAWEHGNDIPAAELCADHPEHQEAVERKIDRLKRMSWMIRSDSGDSDGDETGCDVPDTMIGMTLAGRYRIEAFVAEGGFGRVYKATDPELQRLVAVKVARGKKPGGQVNLVDEARRAAKLRHPGIVPVIDVGNDGERAFIVSALIDGPNLADVIERNRPTPDEAARIVTDIAEALHFAHLAGFLHRDVKPENILLDENRRPLLTDFGLAASFAEVVRRNGVQSGTLMYMSPEQVAGETQLIGPRTDIYSLGVVFYELLTGRLPYQARTPGALREQVLFRPPVPPRSLNPQASEELDAICLRCLSKLPADRFTSAAELASALRAAPTRRWYRPSLRGLWLILLVVSLFVAGLVLGSMLSSQTDQTPPVELSHEPGVMTFDGTSRIITPVEPFLPCTLEAWVRPTGERHEQFVIGGDVPNFYGLGLGINDNRPCVETIRGGFQADRVILPDQWTHLAAVFAPDETRLYLGGRKIGVGPASQPPTRMTRFVIGNVGEDHAKQFYRGHIRCVRVTKGERYNADFVPDEVFVKDAEDAPTKAILIYDGVVVERVRVVDQSGAGNDGRWQRMKP